MKNLIAIFSFGYWGWGKHVPELKKTFPNHNRTYRGRGLFRVDNHDSYYSLSTHRNQI